jgi:hypothetical protein
MQAQQPSMAMPLIVQVEAKPRAEGGMPVAVVWQGKRRSVVAVEDWETDGESAQATVRLLDETRLWLALEGGQWWCWSAE